MFELLRITGGGDEDAAKAALRILEKKWPHEFWRGPLNPKDRPNVQVIREPLRRMG
jgi:hypothetical protein